MLDVVVNYDYKEKLKVEFYEWYFIEVFELFDCDGLGWVNIDLKIWILKFLYVNWVINIYYNMLKCFELIKSGF